MRKPDIVLRGGFAALWLLSCAAPALGGEAGVLTRRYAEADATLTRPGDEKSFLGAGVAALAQAKPDNEARFGEGVLRFLRAIERYGQAQYRFGLRAPRGLSLPFLRLPVPENPQPEEISYEKQRASIQGLLDDLAATEAALAKMDATPVKIVLDLAAVQFDFRGLGASDPEGRLSEILAALHMGSSATAAPLEIAFDNADALWLRGYCHFLSAMGEFVLGYDWRGSFEKSAHIFYPRVSPPPLGGAVESESAKANDGFGRRAELADVIALIHDIRWPVADAARLRRVREHLKQVVALSRETWKAVLAETDDDREWLPGPQQKSGMAALAPVGKEQLDGWMAALDEVDALLDGRKLLPHWRFAQGINLRRVFEEPQPFDAVLWATGHAATPYLQKGPMLSRETWEQWQRVFGGNFVGYAFWFN